MGEGRNAAAEVNSLADRFWNGFLDLSPINATVLGYEQGLDRLDDPGPEGRARARTLMSETLKDADAIEARAGGNAAIPAEERITLDILRIICRVELEQQGQRFDRLKVVDQMDGPQTILPQLAAFQPTETPEQFETFLARLADYPRLHGGQRRSRSRGPRRRSHRRPDRHRTCDRPARTTAGDARRRVAHRSGRQASEAGRPRSSRQGRWQVRSPGRPPLPGRA